MELEIPARTRAELLSDLEIARHQASRFKQAAAIINDDLVEAALRSRARELETLIDVLEAKLAKMPPDWCRFGVPRFALSDLGFTDLRFTGRGDQAKVPRAVAMLESSQPCATSALDRLQRWKLDRLDSSAGIGDQRPPREIAALRRGRNALLAGDPAHRCDLYFPVSTSRVSWSEPPECGDGGDRRVMPYMVANDSKHWKDLALDARRMAEYLTDPKAREHMIACAEAYERLANLAKKHPIYVRSNEG
jgi:hypothetical protein